MIRIRCWKACSPALGLGQLSRNFPAHRPRSCISCPLQLLSLAPPLPAHPHLTPKESRPGESGQSHGDLHGDTAGSLRSRARDMRETMGQSGLIAMVPKKSGSGRGPKRSIRPLPV